MRNRVMIWSSIMFCMLMSACSSSDWTEQACLVLPAPVDLQPPEQASCDLKTVVWQVFVQEAQKEAQKRVQNTDVGQTAADKPSMPILVSENVVQPEACVDINADSMERLMMLPGVGEQRAKAMIQARQKKSFRHKKDVRKVRGIGPKAYQKMASMICDIEKAEQTKSHSK